MGGFTVHRIVTPDTSSSQFVKIFVRAGGREGVRKRKGMDKRRGSLVTYMGAQGECGKGKSSREECIPWDPLFGRSR